MLFALLVTVVRAAQAATLTSGSPIVSELHAEESQVIGLDLQANQLVKLEVLAADLNFKLELLAPNRNCLREVIHRRYGTMTWRFIAPEAGTYQVVIRSLERTPTPHPYQIRMASLSTPAARDQRWEQAADRFYQAEHLRFKWRGEDLQQALKAYQAAAMDWQQSAWPDAIDAWQSIGEVYVIQSDYEKASRAFGKALQLSRWAKDASLISAQLANLGYVSIYLGNTERAASLLAQAQIELNRIEPKLPTFCKPIEAQLWNNLGEVEYARGNLKAALSLFDKAGAQWAEVSNRRGLALARLNAGYCYIDSGSVIQAAEALEQAAKLAAELDDWRLAALAGTARGNLNARLGNNQAALTAHHQARELFYSMGDRQGEAVTLNGLGDVYEMLNLKQEAIDCYSQAFRLNLGIGNKAFAAVSSYYVSKVYCDLENYPQALKYYERSYRMAQQCGKSRMQMLVITDVAIIYTREKKFTPALRLFKQSLAFYTRIGDLRRQALTLCYLGEFYQAKAVQDDAIRTYRRALEIFRRIKDPHGEAECLYRVAELLEEAGKLQEALDESQHSIQIIETERVQVSGQSWRSTYFASVRRHFELHVDILIKLSRQFPEGGFAARGLQASERARARSLLEQLAETGSEIRLGVAPSLLTRERQLQDQLTAKAAYQTRLLSTAHSEAEAAEVESEIRALTVDYDYVQSQIKAQSPAYRRLTQPQPLSLAEIQAALKEDEGTVLLEYMLGDQRSYVWLVNGESLAVKELPGRREVDGLAARVYQELTARQAQPGESMAQYHERVARMEERLCPDAIALSRLLLGPVAKELQASRLLIVSDGAMQYIPFDELPLQDRAEACRDDAPEQSSPPLFTAFEIVHLPSFSSLMLLRQLKAASPCPGRQIAIWADPVYEVDDPRVAQQAANVTGKTPEAEAASGPETRPVAPPFHADLPASWPRLLATRQEATNIKSLASSDQVHLWTGLAATRERVIAEDLQPYRILHFATHGLVNHRHPWLSGLLLSTVDGQGREQNGLLQLPDIYALRLNADLIVLSACQTGLGEALNGEGLVGLTQGFLYAGAKSVAVSLRNIDDKTTELMMTAFYRAMLKEGLSPASALRRSKLEIYEQTHHYSPYVLGAFVIQGEYRLPPGRCDRPRPVSPLLVGVTAAAVLCSITYALYKARRRSRHRIDKGEQMAS